MFARTRENLHSIYLLLFLNVVFFFFQTQDVGKYVTLFALNRESILGGQYWRLFTYQFVHSGAVALFFDLLILYVMGSVIEELWGTRDFVAFFLLSLFGSAAVGLAFDFQLLGSYFLMYSLLFVYAHIFPEQSFLIFFVIPVKVKWIAWVAAAFLVFGVVTRSSSSIAALGGVVASFGWYWLRHGPARLLPRRAPASFRPVAGPPVGNDSASDENLRRFAEIRRAVESGTPEDRAALIDRFTKEIVPGVNICPPADYKPENPDRYCVRCEGFPECSARFLRMAEQGAGRTGEKR